MTDPIYAMFGDRIRELREKKKYTQEELARKVDLSRTSITNIEKGRHRVLLHQVVELAEALDAKPTDLMPKSAPATGEPALRGDVARVIEELRRETPSR